MLNWCEEYPKYERLIFWLSFRIGRSLGVHSSEILGSVFDAYVRCCELFEPEKAEFSTYLTRSAWRKAAHFLLKDKEENRLKKIGGKTKQRIRNEQGIIKAITDKNTYEQDFYLYRIPDQSDEWIEALFELYEFDSKKLWRGITAGLRERDTFILNARFRDGRSLENIGDQLKMSKERVRQLEARALDEVKKNTAKLENIARLFGLFDKGPHVYEYQESA